MINKVSMIELKDAFYAVKLENLIQVRRSEVQYITINLEDMTCDVCSYCGITTAITALNLLGFSLKRKVCDNPDYTTFTIKQKITRG